MSTDSEGMRVGSVGWRSAVVGISEEGRVGNHLIGVTVVGHVCGAFTMR